MRDEEKTRLIRTGRDEEPVTKTAKRSDTKSSDSAGLTRVITARSRSGDGDGQQQDEYELVVGWLVVVDGPGRGSTCEIFYGMNSIGRGPEERIPLDFGDDAISREAHAYVVFDEKQQDFYLQHGGKSNLVRLNDKPVLSPQELKRGDMIEIGQTRLMFVPLCGDDFGWEETTS